MGVRCGTQGFALRKEKGNKMSNETTIPPCPFCEKIPSTTQGYSDGAPPLRTWVSCKTLGCVLHDLEFLLEKWSVRATPTAPNNLVACVNCKAPVEVTTANAIRCGECAVPSSEAAQGEIERLTKLTKRVYGTISGGNLYVRGFHDEGDVGTDGEPWVVEEESGTHWSCYDVEFTPDKDYIEELRLSVSRLYRQLEQKTEDSVLVKSLRGQLVERAATITRLTTDLAAVRTAVWDEAISIAKAAAWSTKNHDIGAHDLEDCATCAAASQATEVVAALTAAKESR